MSACLVVVAEPAREALPAVLVERICRRFAGASRWLAPDAAAEILLDAMPKPGAIAAELGDARVDWALLPTAGRRKAILVSDMDSTIIDIECVDELADFAGVKSEVAAVTRQAMNGKLDFKAALETRVALLEGVPETAIREICEHRMSLNPGARVLVRTMRRAGALTCLVSGGFTVFTSYVAERAGFERHRGNRLELHDGRLTGRVLPPVLGAAAKLETLEALAAERGLKAEACLAVGDGANDGPMLEAAGLAVAFRPHAVLRPVADLVLDHAGLEAALYLQGYAAADLVTD